MKGLAAGPFYWGLVVIALTGLRTTCGGAPHLQQTLLEWFDAWNRRDRSSMEAVFAAEGTFASVDGKVGPPSTQAPAFAGLWGLVPDARIRATRWIPTERGVTVAWVVEGKGGNTGQIVRFHGLTVVEGSNGRITAMRVYFDIAPLLRLLPRPAHS